MPDATDGNQGQENSGPGNRRMPPPADGPLTIKQQRDAKRRQKVEKAKLQEIKVKQNRRFGLLVGAIAVVVVIALFTFVVVTGKQKDSSSAGSIVGVQTFKGLTTNHVHAIVHYQQTPPAGGDHSPELLNCAIYAKQVPNERAVQSLEHGAVWITYNPAVISGDKLARLRKTIPKTFVILSPFDGLPAPIVTSAWGAQLQVSRVDDPRIVAFIAKYRESTSAPEPGAPCTGGIDGPGKVS